MSQPFWKRYGTMDEFIDALLLRMKEIGLSQDLMPRTSGGSSLGSSSTRFGSAYVSYVYPTAIYNTGQFYLNKKVSKTTTYTALVTDCVILVDTSGGAWTLTLPASTSGHILFIKKTDVSGNALTIDGNAAETIDGAATNAEIDAQYDCLILYADGSNWHIIGRWIH